MAEYSEKSVRESSPESYALFGMIRGIISDTLDKPVNRTLDPSQKIELLSSFADLVANKPPHYQRLTGFDFSDMWDALENRPDLMFGLFYTLKIGGQPDLVAIKNGNFVFADCYAESPEARESLRLTYPQIADFANKIGLKVISEDVYRLMQEKGRFDEGTWTYLNTPEEMLRGKRTQALQGCRRGNTIYVQNVRADMAYEDDGFRFMLEVPMV